MIGRKGIVATACAAGAAVVVTAGILVAAHPIDDARAESVREQVKTSTALVEKGELRGTTTKPGVLARTEGSTILAGPTGVLTEVPEVGAVIKPGEALYRVDNVPVVAFAGELPQWRAFESGMADGPDVMQLEENLHAWGYLNQAATDHFDWYTTVAIEKWQKATGQQVTGTIALGAIHFGSGDQVVSDRKAIVGDTVSSGQELYLTTGTEKVVTVDLPIGSTLAKADGEVEVVLPVGGSTPGRVRSVGDPVTDEDGKTTVPVVIVLADAAKVTDLDQIDVSVGFVSETRKNVLSVPVTALGARVGGGFRVQVSGAGGVTKNVAVEVGLFAGDRVEITSGNLTAGDRVVVPA
jgi:multidrug efflux pump subunit AcrA (membrane-fusion protein)